MFNKIQKRFLSTLKYDNKIRSSYVFNTTQCGLNIQQNLSKPFNKILIANRGEIACRIIRTCKELGIKTVSIYSDADKDSLFVNMSDECYYIGTSSVNDSYLQLNKIINIAKECNAEAIHPGYGLLSENPEFVRQCEYNNIQFIGPPSQAMEDMGIKSKAKYIMEAASVPITPGYHGNDQSYDRFVIECQNIGYPVMLKAVSGGGGKGIRPVFNENELYNAYNICKNEGLRSFNNSDLLVEKFVPYARHIEFQIFTDKFGNGIHLYERDCSVQRGNQKIFEESPAPYISNEMRNKMGQSAVNAAIATNYVGAGTVEFLVDPETNEYYFMEMNTRLQVEHCVTEMNVGLDLVQWQLHVASGKELPIKNQEDIPFNGHTIEARIYAENPFNNFQATIGELKYLNLPKINQYNGDNTIRVETGVRQNDIITQYYDSMIAKLVCHNKNGDRKELLEFMHNVLGKFNVAGDGIQTNIEFLRNILNNNVFIKGGVTTNYLNEYFDDVFVKIKPNDMSIILAGFGNYLINTIHKNDELFTDKLLQIFYEDDNESIIDYNINLNKYQKNNNEYELELNNNKYIISDIELKPINNDNYEIYGKLNKNTKLHFIACIYSNKITIFYESNKFDFITSKEIKLNYPGNEYYQSNLEGWTFNDIIDTSNLDIFTYKSEMPCNVLKYHINKDDIIKKGDILVTIEAMKKQMDIKSDVDGQIIYVCDKYTNIKKSQDLVKISTQ